MVGKTYLRYEYHTNNSVICSPQCNTMAVGTLAQTQAGASANNNVASSLSTVAFLPSLESIGMWALGSGKFLGSISPAACDMANATSLRTDSGVGYQNLRVAASTNEVSTILLIEPKEGTDDKEWKLIVGYMNGYVAHFRGVPNRDATITDSPLVWTCDVFALGHKPDTQVLALAVIGAHSDSGAGGTSSEYIVCSGGQDTDISIWDVTAQEPLYRLRGHRGGVVSICFVPQRSNDNINKSALPSSSSAAEKSGLFGANCGSLLVSGAADGMIKVWDLSVQQCIQTLVASDTQITSMYYMAAPEVEMSGRIAVYNARGENKDADEIATAASAKKDSFTPPVISGRLFVGLRENIIKVYAVPTAMSASDALEVGMDSALVPYGTIARKTHKAVTGIFTSPDSTMLGARSADTVEIFSICDEEELKRKVAQKRRRYIAAQKKKGGDAEADAWGAGGDSNLGGYLGGRDWGLEEVQMLKCFNFHASSVGSGGGSNAHAEEAEDGAEGAAAAASAKRRLRAAAFSPRHAQTTNSETSLRNVQLVVTYNDNSVEVLACEEREIEVVTGASAGRTLGELKTMSSLTFSGHRHDIRGVEFVDSDEAMVTFSRDSIKLWNIASAQQRMLNSGNRTVKNGFSSNFDEDLDSQYRNRILDECYYNNVAPAPASILKVVSSVVPSSVVRTTSSMTIKGHTVTAASFTAVCCIASDVVCVGDDLGGLFLINLKTSDVLYSDPHAHAGAIKSITRLPQDAGFATIGADRRVVTWTLSMVQDEVEVEEEHDEVTAKKGAKRGRDVDQASTKTLVKKTLPPKLVLQPTHEMELNETPLFLRYSYMAASQTNGSTFTSPYGRSSAADASAPPPPKDLYAIGLQDNNIQLFYADSNKPFLTLYGHKLTPTDVCFSSDGNLIASVGLDKSLRFWGADFGDCHKAIHAHDDYITRVQFVPSTHYVVTCSLDGSVKHWDGDNWTMIQMFRFHQRGLYGLAISGNGSYFASAGVDRCIRIAKRTDEMLFPEEEESRITQEAMDNESARRAALQKLDEKGVEVGVPSTVTTASANAAETLMDALDMVSSEVQRMGTVNASGDGGHVQEQNTALLLKNRTVWEYLWGVLESIRPSELRHCLGSLTSIHLTALVQYLAQMDAHNAILNYETAAKILLALVAPPQGSSSRPILHFEAGGNHIAGASSGGLSRKARKAQEAADSQRKKQGEERLIASLSQLEALRNSISTRLHKQSDSLQGNVASLRFLLGAIEKKEQVQFFDLSKIQGHKKQYHSRAFNE